MTVGGMRSRPISALHPSPRDAERGESGEAQTGKPIRGSPLRPPSLAAPPRASHAPIRPAALRLVSVTA